MRNYSEEVGKRITRYKLLLANKIDSTVSKDVSSEVFINNDTFNLTKPIQTAASAITTDVKAKFST